MNYFQNMRCFFKKGVSFEIITDIFVGFVCFLFYFSCAYSIHIIVLDLIHEVRSTLTALDTYTCEYTMYTIILWRTFRKLIAGNNRVSCSIAWNVSSAPLAIICNKFNLRNIITSSRKRHRTWSAGLWLFRTWRLHFLIRNIVDSIYIALMLPPMVEATCVSDNIFTLADELVAAIEERSESQTEPTSPSLLTTVDQTLHNRRWAKQKGRKR